MTVLAALAAAIGAPTDSGAVSPTAIQTDAMALLLAEAQAGMPAQDVLVLEALVNGQRSGVVFVLIDAGALAVEETALKRWGVAIPQGPVREAGGRRFVPVAGLPGARASIDEPTQQLLLDLPPLLFPGVVVSFEGSASPVPAVPAWAAFFNYDLFAFASRSDSYGAGLFEIGTSGPYGAGLVTVSANTSEQFGGGSRGAVLLDAAWRYDDPSGMRTLTLGTAISRTGAWGRSLRFAGVQYGTNFALQPNLITYPLQAFSGTAIVPSTVDVFVNGSRVGAQAVPPGPFTITDVPVVTGSGDVQLVVRDAFGQQQVISQPFYASRQLLKPGLDDFTLSVGAKRRDYGIESFGDDGGYASGYWRRGLADTVTFEVAGEADHDVQALGAAIDFVPGRYGVVSLGAAGSRDGDGTGYLGLAGYQYQGPRFNFGVRSVWASADFRVPAEDGAGRLQRSTVASTAYSFGPVGTVAIAWADQRYRSEPDTSMLAITYSASLTSRAFLNLSVSRSHGSVSQTAAFASLVVALDDRTSASFDVNATSRDAGTRTVVGATLQRSLPIGEGWGYRVRAASDRQYQVGGAYAGPYGRYGIEVAGFEGDAAARASIAGGIGTLGGVVFASRPILDSFGLVRIEGVEGVDVYQNGSLAGQTDGDGALVLTRLNPYMENRIAIDDKRVPIDIALNAREQRVAPAYRSGVIVDFGARRLPNALVEVRLPGGEPLPPGAEVRRLGGGAVYLVGFDGEVFIPDLSFGATYVAQWPGERCEFAVPAAAAPLAAMPRLGPITCAARRERS